MPSASQENESQLGAHLIKAAGCSPSQAFKVRPPVKPKPVKKPPAPDLACLVEGIASSITGHIQKQASADSAHQNSPGFSQSSTSPDSAMQQSFSSSSSSCDTTTGDKPSCRDDGYSSQSAVSITNGDSYTLSLPPVAATAGAVCLNSISPQKSYSCQPSTGGADSTDSVKDPDQKCASVRDIRAYFEGRFEEMKSSTENVQASPHHGARAKHPACPENPATSVPIRNGAISQSAIMRQQRLSSSNLSHSDSCIYRPKPANRLSRPSGRQCGCWRSRTKRTWQWRARAHSDTDIQFSPRTTTGKKQPPAVPKRPPSTQLKPKPYPKPTVQTPDSVHVTKKLPIGMAANHATHKVPNGTPGGNHVAPRGHMMNGEVYVGHVMLQEGVPNLASYGLPSLSYGGTRLLGDGSSSSPHRGKKLLEMRETCEGSESGYKSEDSLVSCSRTLLWETKNEQR